MTCEEAFQKLFKSFYLFEEVWRVLMKKNGGAT